MTPNLLILGGTTEATALARLVAEAGLRGTVSFAGRVDRPRRQPLPQRVGGFGGVAGLVDFIRAEGITHLVDATHPFAAQMSTNAVQAAKQVGIPMVTLTRAAWTPQQGDRWMHVPDIAGAVAALDCPPRRVMLAVGRMHLPDFARNPQHFYLLRLVDPPQSPPPFDEYHVIVDRGPFTEAGDRALMKDYEINLVVSKNAGGSGAAAKLAAARALGLRVVMIDRPALLERREMASPQEVLDWVAHAGTDLGV